MVEWKKEEARWKLKNEKNKYENYLTKRKYILRRIKVGQITGWNIQFFKCKNSASEPVAQTTMIQMFETRIFLQVLNIAHIRTQTPRADIS